MRANLKPPVEFNFLDGYLFRLMQEIASEQGLDDSGFYGYYGHRVKERMGALMEYEVNLVRHLLAGYRSYRVVHAGIGVGTVACALACSGMPVIGVEADDKRVASARRLRAAVLETWREARYEIMHGFFPTAVPEAAFGADAILLFTNVGSGWDKAALDSVIAVMPRFGQVFLDLRMLGTVREEEAHRVALYDRIATTARWAERLPYVSPGIHLARFVF